jgi:hypothetical protein
MNELKIWGLRSDATNHQNLAHGRRAGDVIGASPQHALLLAFSSFTWI